MIFSLVSLFACARQTEYPVAPPYILHPSGEFPIVATYALSHPFMTDQHMKWVKEAGINTVSMVLNQQDADSLIRLADKFDMAVLVSPYGIRDANRNLDIVNHYRDMSPVWGYFVKDEPDASQFSLLASNDSLLRSYDASKLRVYNLLPAVSSAQLGSKDYESYVSDFVSAVNPSFISFDIYPVKTDKKGKIFIEPILYKTIEVIRKVSEESGRPFWSFNLSTPHWNYPVPKREYLRFSVFTALAYGAQGLLFYTYLMPDFDKNVGEYGNGPIDWNGKRTEVWYVVRDVNKEVKNLEKVFLGAKVLDVSQTGMRIPEGTKRLTTLPDPFGILESDGEGFTVSHLQNGDAEYLLIVNRDVENKQHVYLSHRRPVKRIYGNGQEKTFGGQRFTIAPGGYAIFKI